MPHRIPALNDSGPIEVATAAGTRRRSVKWADTTQRWDQVRRSIVTTPSEARASWSEVVENLDKLKVDDLDDDDSIHDNEVYNRVNSSDFDVSASAEYNNSSMASMGSAFSECSISRTLGGFKGSRKGEIGDVDEDSDISRDEGGVEGK